MYIYIYIYIDVCIYICICCSLRGAWHAHRDCESVSWTGLGGMLPSDRYYLYNHIIFIGRQSSGAYFKIDSVCFFLNPRC